MSNTLRSICKKISLYGILFFSIMLFAGCSSGSDGSSNNSNSGGGGGNDKHITSLSISPSGSSNIRKGLTQQYKAMATYSDGTTTSINTGITWNSSDTSVATIDNDGLATVVGSTGTTNITATLSGVTSKSAILTATDQTIKSIVISPESSTLPKGSPQQYKAMATYSDGTTTSINTGITWNSSDTSVATIDNDGLATVVGSTGTTNITATYNNITSNQATLTVAIKTIKAIAITPLVSVINAGLTQQYTARVIYSDNESSPIDTGITWQSTDKSVATIDNNGLATVIASAGTTCITANWSGVVSNVAILTATDKTAVSISISPRSVNLPIESTQQYSVEVNYSDGSSSSINTEITWNSSDSSVATIDKNTGLATVVASTGTTNITANWHGMQDSTTLTAIDKLISISIIPSDTILMNQNDKLQFKAQGTYFSGIISDVTSLVNWHSTVPSVVTINPVGLAIAGTIGGEVSYIYADSLDKRIRSNITQVVVHY